MQLHHENLIEISMISNFSKITKLKNVTWYREMDISFGFSDRQLSKICWKILDNFQKNFLLHPSEINRRNSPTHDDFSGSRRDWLAPPEKFIGCYASDSNNHLVNKRLLVLPEGCFLVLPETKSFFFQVLSTFHFL